MCPMLFRLLTSRGEADATAFKEFAKIRSRSSDIKAHAAARRLDRTAADLATRKRRCRHEHERLTVIASAKALDGF